MEETKQTHHQDIQQITFLLQLKGKLSQIMFKMGSGWSGGCNDWVEDLLVEIGSKIQIDWGFSEVMKMQSMFLECRWVPLKGLNFFEVPLRVFYI